LNAAVFSGANLKKGKKKGLLVFRRGKEKRGVRLIIAEEEGERKKKRKARLRSAPHRTGKRKKKKKRKSTTLSPHLRERKRRRSRDITKKDEDGKKKKDQSPTRPTKRKGEKKENSSPAVGINIGRRKQSNSRYCEGWRKKKSLIQLTSWTLREGGKKKKKKEGFSSACWRWEKTLRLAIGRPELRERDSKEKHPRPCRASLISRNKKRKTHAPPRG